jgi:chromosome segregation ATPase
VNKDRRKLIASLQERINALQSEVVDIHEAEEEYRDNMPMQQGERFDAADNAVDMLDGAVQSLAEAMDQLEQAAQ